MMLFNMDCVNHIVKYGVCPKGAGIHKKTKKAYVYFDKDDVKFQNAMEEWNEKCKRRNK
ncbi:hypothetical protein H9L25_00830 [Terrisporobacter mayombei]|nr:hypothetical protein [Terrisporobacter mayombei]